MSRAAVLLLPGLLCDAAVWTAQCEALGAEADCHVPDYALLDSITAMARQVLSDTAAQRFSLVGHSMGGRVALEMLRLAPQRVERLALLDTGTDPLQAGEAGERERSQRMALIAIARARGMRAMGEQWARGMVHPSRLDSPLFDRILEMIERKPLAVFEAQIAALLGRPDARPTLAGIACPLLLLCGREDLWSPLARHEQMHRNAPGSALVVIEDAGHMSTMEQPDEVSRALLAWLHTPAAAKGA
ncbi:MAG TPA: alpha/beta hydrolase [Ideonella sp.]|nr:alpha/beta hydrolase [Ideonella sp.]